MGSRERRRMASWKLLLADPKGRVVEHPYVSFRQACVKVTAGSA